MNNDKQLGVHRHEPFAKGVCRERSRRAKRDESAAKNAAASNEGKEKRREQRNARASVWYWKRKPVLTA